MQNIQYMKYLESENWRLLKEQIHERSGGICEICQNALGEDVHHLTYERIFNELLIDLVHVCRNCHKSQHDITDTSVDFYELLPEERLEREKEEWCESFLKEREL
jgi:hypothetical protein